MTFANDTAILSTSCDYVEATANLHHTRKMYWLQGRLFTSSLANKKLLPYPQIRVDIWPTTMGINRNVIDAFKIKSCTHITRAPWFIRGEQVHTNLAIVPVDQVHQEYSRLHKLHLHKHINCLVLDLLNTTQSFGFQDVTLSICFRIVARCSNLLINKFI